MIDRLVAAGAPVDRCCRVLGVARQNYYKSKPRPTTSTQLRRQGLTGLIREIHVASRGTPGYRRIHAELTMAMGVKVCSHTVSVLHDLGRHVSVAGIVAGQEPTRCG
ncbi:transposase [Nocardia nova]|nr:transposase [Nocardia nova]